MYRLESLLLVTCYESIQYGFVSCQVLVESHLEFSKVYFVETVLILKCLLSLGSTFGP